MAGAGTSVFGDLALKRFGFGVGAGKEWRELRVGVGIGKVGVGYRVRFGVGAGIRLVKSWGRNNGWKLFSLELGLGIVRVEAGISVGESWGWNYFAKTSAGVEIRVEKSYGWV